MIKLHPSKDAIAVTLSQGSLSLALRVIASKYALANYKVTYRSLIMDAQAAC